MMTVAIADKIQLTDFWCILPLLLTNLTPTRKLRAYFQVSLTLQTTPVTKSLQKKNSHCNIQSLKLSSGKNRGFRLADGGVCRYKPAKADGSLEITSLRKIKTTPQLQYPRPTKPDRNSSTRNIQCPMKKPSSTREQGTPPPKHMHRQKRGVVTSIHR